MEMIYNTENIELSYIESNDGNSVKIDIIDKHGHYDDTIELSIDQARDLLEGLKSIENNLKET